MLRRDLLRAWMATPLAGWFGPLWPGSAVGVPGEVLDAAAIYRRAFGWAKGLGPEDLGWLRESGVAAIDGGRADSLIRRARLALRAIREASGLDRCHWGVEILDAEDLGRNRLDLASTDLIRLACLSARRLARSGRGREAAGDVFAALTLAHRVGTGGVLMGRILECSGEDSAFRTLGWILPDLDPPALDDLAERLETLPPPEAPSATIVPESRFIIVSTRSKLAVATSKIEGEAWADLGIDAERAEALARLTGGDRPGLRAHLDATGPAFAELARRLDLPRPGCRPALDEFAESHRATWPIVAGLVEAAWGIRHVVDRMRAFRSLAKAAIALIRDGEAAFREIPDPFGDGPFDLERRGAGAVIRSALRDEGRPEVSLEIGEVGPAV